jgi:hypothetical protein
MLSALLARSRRPQPPAAQPLPPDAPAPIPSVGDAARAPRQLAKIAQASVDLAALGPRLASLAGEMEKQAQNQARRASAIAATMDGLAGDLEQAVAELRTSSVQMHGALKTVERIADHTRLLSVNASIEAARAGEAGRAFSVVVDEVKRLADTTGQSTHLIEDRMTEIETSVAKVAAVTVAESSADAADATRTVAAVNHEVRGMADSASVQLDSAKSVHSMGDQINALTELLLLTVGKFRFEAHARAQAAVEALLPELIDAIDHRGKLERAIERWLPAHAYFELGYLTDAHGRQIIDNLRLRDGHVDHDASGFGREWSDRPWYRDALQHRGIASTDIYRSAATGDFCFTVVAALPDASGKLIGVFAADVNFLRLVSQ